MEAENEIILYQPDSTIRLEVKVENETVWLTQQQMAELFQATKQNISLHIRNIYKEGELEEKATVKEYLTVQKEGKRNVQRKISYYNLDVIISVGYRVKSLQGTRFRQWANNILREYLLRGYSVNQRMIQLEDKIDRRFSEYDQHFRELDGKVDFFVHSSLPQKEGILFDGRIFDAYVFICDLIESAKKRIILIDNYADYSVLQQLDKRAPGVSALIFTSDKNEAIKIDLKRHNKQYPPIDLKIYNKAHDRFLIIDNTIYHIGASLKDLGKKLFGFSRMEEMTADELLSRLKSKA